MMMRRWLVFLFVMIIAGTAGVTGAVAQHRIAVLLPQNGPFAAYGHLQRQGYELARVTLEGAGIPVTVRYFDVGQPRMEMASFLKTTVLPWKPDILVGPYSSQAARQVVASLQDSPLPVLIPTATLDAITARPDRPVYRVATPGSLLSGTVQKFLLEKQAEWALSHLTVIAETTPFAQGAARSLMTLLDTDGLPQPVILNYEPGQLPDLSGLQARAGSAVIMISRSAADCIELTETLGETTRIIGYIAGFLTPQYSAFSREHTGEVYVLSPWQDDAPQRHVSSFIQAFESKYADAFSHSYPQYHNVQAYSALMIAAQALDQAARQKGPVSDLLDTREFVTPLGMLRFADFGGYYRQSLLGPVIQKVDHGTRRTVFPAHRMGQVSLSEAPAESPSFLRLLVNNQFVALFLIIGLGLLIGNVKVAGISLGSSAVLFVALLAGHFHLTIPAGVGTLGLVLFIYCVGIGAGPRFFSAFARQGITLAKIAVVTVTTAGTLTYLFVRFAGIPLDLGVGLFAGALTSTPALAAALDSLKEAGGNVSVGYGIAYPFGVIGVVLFVQLLPRLLRKDISDLSRQLESRSGAASSIIRVLVNVENNALAGKSIFQNPFIQDAGCVVSRVFEANALHIIQSTDTFTVGQVLLVVGDERAMDQVIDHIGTRSSEQLPTNLDKDMMQMVITSGAIIGQSLNALDLLKHYGITMTRVTRNDVTFVPRMDTVLERYDQVKVIGDAQGLSAFSQLCGHKARAIHETDLLSLAGGILIGVIVGMVPLSIAGSGTIRLGVTGGLLLVALLLGHFGRIGRIGGRIPYASRMLMMELGLVFFLANAGIKAGASVWETLQAFGVVLFFAGAVITLLPLAISYCVATYVYKINLLEALGGVCGGMTSTPALGAIKARTDSEVPVISYAAAYPVALILMIIAAQVLISLLG